ncbi:MAG: DMT family transporter [Sphaerochaetaceae bacterium]
MESNSNRKDGLAILLAFITVVFWSSGFVFTRLAVRYFSPFSLGLLRYGTATVVVVAIGLCKRIGLPKAKDIPLFLLMGALGFTFYMILFNQAMLTISAATGSILGATVPVMTALFSAWFFKEKISVVGWFSIAVNFVGILILTLWHGTFSLESGLVLMVAAAVSFAAYNLMQRFATKNYTPLQATVYSIVSGTLLLMVFLPQLLKELSTAPLEGILDGVYMGIFPSAIGFILWTKALSYASHMNTVTNFMFVTPLLSTILEYIMTKEVPDTGTILGGTIILVGLMLFSYRSRIGTLLAHRKNT